MSKTMGRQGRSSRSYAANYRVVPAAGSLPPLIESESHSMDELADALVTYEDILKALEVFHEKSEPTWHTEPD